MRVKRILTTTAFAYLLGVSLAIAPVLSTVSAMPDAWVQYYTLHSSNNTIYLYNSGTKEIRRVYQSGRINPTQAAFSLDGKRMAFLRKLNNDTGSVMIVNNDGSGLRRVCATFAPTTQHYSGTSTICWTDKGLFWSESDNRIYWADPQTGQSKVLGTLTTDTKGNLFSMSRDGSKAYLRTDFNTAAGVGGLFFEVDAAISGIVNERPFPNPLWDHGSAMLQDGSGVLWVVWHCGHYGNPAGCAGHQRFVLRNFADMTQWTMVVPPDPDTTEVSGPMSGPVSSPSSPDHFLYRRGGWDDYSCTIFNYKTGEWIDVTPRTIAPGGPIDVLPRLSIQGGFWLGELPNPHDTTPYIALNKSLVMFTAQSAQDGSDTITVTNGGVGTLTALTISKTPAGDWLTVSTHGSGNMQHIVVRADTAGLARGDYQCVVTVSGGGAPNSAAFTVRLSTGSSLLPPSNLTVSLLGETWTELDAALRWSDNSANESGFAVERAVSPQPFTRIAVTAANAEAHTDTTVIRGTTYQYRLRSFSGSDSSAYSDTLIVYIPLQPIVITSPQTAESWTLNQPQRVQWTAVGVTTVQIEYTLDAGETWTLITSSGGISQGGVGWGDYVWTPPISLGQQPSVQIRVAQYQDAGTADYSGVFSLVTANASLFAPRTVTPQQGLTLRRANGVLTVDYRVNQGLVALLTVHDIRGRLLGRFERCAASGSVVIGRSSMLPSSFLVIQLESFNPATGVSHTVRSTTCAGVR